MPIKGLIDISETSIRQGLPEIGRAYKGDPKESNRPGKDLDYFRFEFNPQFAEFKEQFVAMYSDEDGVFEPDAFERVHVAAETAAEAFDYWWEEWNSTQTLLHKCDGEQQVRWFDDATKMYANGTKACAKLPDNTQHECQCQRVGRLALILPEFTAVTGVFGYFLFQTHSINDIITIYQTLDMAEKLARKSNRSLMSVPFTFGRVSQKISAPHSAKNKQGEYERTGKRMVVSKSLFFLHTDPDFTRQVLLPALVNAPALPAPKPEENKVVELDTGKFAKNLGTGSEPRRMAFVPPKQADEDTVDSGPITIEFTSSAVKYIGSGTMAYLLFSNGGDEPARLFWRDFEKKLHPLGAEFVAFAENLRPGSQDQKPLDLPAPVSIKAKTSTTPSGATFWEVDTLACAEIDDTPEPEAKAS